MARSRLVTVEPVLFMFMLAIFMDFPIQEQLIYKKICNSAYNNTICKHTELKKYKTEETYVQSHTSTWMLYIKIASTFPSMLAVIILGPCSDKIGRKFVMVLPLIGGCIGAAAMIVNAYYIHLHVSYMLIGSIISGFFGNFAMVLMAVFSYMADITTAKNRTLRVTILEAMVFVGGCLGEIVGGLMVDNVGFYVTFCVVLGVNAINLLYVVICIPEVYFPEKKSSFSDVICNCKDVANAVVIFAKKRAGKQQRMLVILLFSFFCSLIGKKQEIII